jgi:hypothetical protein
MIEEKEFSASSLILSVTDVSFPSRLFNNFYTFLLSLHPSARTAEAGED